MRFKKLLLKKGSFSSCLNATKYDCFHLPKGSVYGYIKKGRINNNSSFLSAESEGFEPPDLLQSTVFKTAAFDHSASFPEAKVRTPVKTANYECFFFI